MKTFIHQCLAISLGALAWPTEPLRTESADSSTLSGNWRGLRRLWAEQSAKFEATYTFDVITDRRASSERGAKTLGAIDPQLTVDSATLLNRPRLPLSIPAPIVRCTTPWRLVRALIFPC